MKFYLSLFVAWLLLCVPSNADWLAFRGSTANGVAQGDAPISCDESTIKWEIETPGRGVSSPIVVGDQVIVTASSGLRSERLHVVSYDVATGEKQWHRQFWATGRTLCHPTSANAAPTPASDGENIVAFFSSNDVVCLGAQGDLKWYRGLGNDNPRAGNDVGMASSPLLAEGVAICQVENQGDSFVEAMDVANGKSLWRLDRPKSANWTSPVYLPPGNDPGAEGLVLLKSDEGISAHSVRSGDEAWKYDADVGGIPTMVVTEKRIYVPGSTFLVLDRTNTTPELAWDSSKVKPSPSPIVDGQRIYFINSAGVMNCVDSESGDQLWQTRVGGKYWASPILAGKHLYSVNDAGQLTILTTDGKKVAEHKFDGNVLGSPAISGGALFVRGESKLWKIANQ